MWASCPFQSGGNPDLAIFCSELRQKLENDELIIADGAYRDVSCLYNDGFPLRVLRIIRARQESLFSRLKNFNVLTQKFRQNLSRNKDGFFSILNLTQISLENGYPLFKVELE